jgi:hypothetical protein
LSTSCSAGAQRLAEAIRFTRARCDALCLFLDDGRIELDTNTVERAIRPITRPPLRGIERLFRPMGDRRHAR